MRLIRFVDMVFGMQEMLAHVAIGREQEQARRVLIEPANGIEARI